MKRLSRAVKETIKELSPELENISTRYEKGWKGDSLLSALELNRNQDMERCSTGPGPHRADLLFLFNRKLVRERLSRGEQKALSTALLITQARLMESSGETPLLLMDDLASEFDEAHLANVLNSGLELNCQVWITGTSRSPYGSIAGINHALFHVEQGEIAT
jgi:DNA replication and repair protein RecF